MTRIAKLLLLAGLSPALLACRLYEPERYTRTTTDADPHTLRVLMIGDSLTYYNDMPGLLQQFSSRQPRPLYVEKITAPLWSLRANWEFSDARRRIDDGRWDFVVLQDYSRKPVTNPRDCLKYYELFSERAKRSGAKVIVFENWTRRGRDDEFDAMMATYSLILQHTGALPAPIGAAFRLAKTTRPDIHLLLDDRHPADAGSYLAACVLYDVIYHRPSAALPWDLPAPKVTRGLMEALRAIADQAVADSADATSTSPEQISPRNPAP